MSLLLLFRGKSSEVVPEVIHSRPHRMRFLADGLSILIDEDDEELMALLVMVVPLLNRRV